MANHNGITKSPLRFNDVDPAVAARRRIKYAGEDDAAYDRAISELETAKPVTPSGIKAVFELFASRAMSIGDEMSPEMMAMMARNIVSGLNRLARKVE